MYKYLYFIRRNEVGIPRPGPWVPIHLCSKKTDSSIDFKKYQMRTRVLESNPSRRQGIMISSPLSSPMHDHHKITCSLAVLQSRILSRVARTPGADEFQLKRHQILSAMRAFGLIIIHYLLRVRGTIIRILLLTRTVLSSPTCSSICIIRNKFSSEQTHLPLYLF